MQQVSYCGHLTIPLQLFCNLCVNFLREYLQRLRRVHTIFYSLRFLFQTYNSLYQTSTPWKVKSAFAKTGIFGYNGLWDIQGCFFNCSTQISVLKRKTLFSQQGSFLHPEFHGTESLIGCPSFFILVLKIGRDS